MALLKTSPATTRHGCKEECTFAYRLPSQDGEQGGDHDAHSFHTLKGRRLVMAGLVVQPRGKTSSRTPSKRRLCLASREGMRDISNDAPRCEAVLQTVAALIRDGTAVKGAARNI